MRSFTRDGSAGVRAPATFRGLIDKIPYLVDLGVTAVELLPVTELDELDNDRVDPVLADTKLIAEAWDAAGLYQVGRFPNWGRWAEWNGRFRDDIRRFVRGDPGMVGNLLDWSSLGTSADLHCSFRLLNAFRKSHDLLRFDSILVTDGFGPQITWHGVRLGEPDWSHESRSLAMHLSGSTRQGRADDVYLIANAHWEAYDFALPEPTGARWCRFVDTALPGDGAIVDPAAPCPLADRYQYRVESRSTVVLVAREVGA